MNEWSYQEAFGRNLSLVSEAEQEKLRNSRIAIAGMGGVEKSGSGSISKFNNQQYVIASPFSTDWLSRS